jgi:hypothetical protein
MLIDSSYVKSFLTLPPSYRKELQKMFKVYDLVGKFSSSYNVRDAKYTAIEYATTNYQASVLNSAIYASLPWEDQ